MSETIIEALAARLAAHGVCRFFGVPGGDCSLDLIEAAARHGIEFVVTRTETAGAIMAAATAQLTGAPGVLMTTRGPGLANAVNGIAAAKLDRAPLLVLADGHEPHQAHASHQRFDQAAVVRPLVKAESWLAEADPAAEIEQLIAIARTPPQGPVYVELVGQRIRAPLPAGATATPPPPAAPAPAPAAVAAAEAVLRASRRPVIIAGLQAAEPGAAAALRRLARAWGAPVLATYMAKGAFPDTDPLAVGPFIAGAAEDALLRSADAILLFGADPIEFLPTPWRYKAPTVMLTTHAFDREFHPWVAEVVGSLTDSAGLLEATVKPGGWSAGEIAAQRAAMQAAARTGTAARGVSPHALVDAVVAAAPDGARIAVDAGAHMLPVMALWPSELPHGALISRGLATMGGALPSAIAASLAEPERPVVAFTGDGGLMMCLAELATAVQAGCRKLVVVVFNDAAMAMIEVKQRRRQFPARGMDYDTADFAAAAAAFGWRGFSVAAPEQLAGALQQAFAADRPALVDVTVDREAYHSLLPALRG
ncbi:thiamine pyrophosphate-dependent enzyme [Siccirubricoccus sp. KC 17139]|uniref:Thiamine pyrophosphate-dependent enzyme n=1 Tax=Siccirubricoccus soli TaxID=2899147 RepID=A0ABT1CZG7_9PROT|nr:thiamine pyrophosphate-dependent enzyme [Siccirubricoccus soli]MCO6415073.1 thiamine pyrophosphate-dependent enzyme [Siccirubricoccus soli]MCP2681204.1 thiamine pyrophosphate-binding protein [Siccirubricoccus soli]